MEMLNRRQFVKQAGGWAGVGAALTFWEGCAHNEINPSTSVNFTVNLTDS